MHNMGIFFNFGGFFFVFKRPDKTATPRQPNQSPFPQSPPALCVYLFSKTPNTFNDFDDFDCYELGDFHKVVREHINHETQLEH